MAAIDNKYGKVTTENKEFYEDEPVFVIRAQDEMAFVAIDAYRDEAQRRKMPKKFINAITAAALCIIEWQQSHPNLVKMPD